MQMGSGLPLGLGRRAARLGARELGLMCKGREQTAPSYKFLNGSAPQINKKQDSYIA
jgi:hypothetical protein